MNAKLRPLGSTLGTHVLFHRQMSAWMEKAYNGHTCSGKLQPPPRKAGIHPDKDNDTAQNGETGSLAKAHASIYKQPALDRLLLGNIFSF